MTRNEAYAVLRRLRAGDDEALAAIATMVIGEPMVGDVQNEMPTHYWHNGKLVEYERLPMLSGASLEIVRTS